MAAAGWYEDPTDRTRLRYWDGMTWTLNVGYDGQMWSSPLTTWAPPPGSPPPPPPPAGWGVPAGYQPVPIGSTAYGRPDRPPFSSVRSLAVALVWLFAGAAVAAALWLLALFNQRAVLQRIADGDVVSRTDANVADGLVGGAVVVFAMVALAIFVVMIVFVYRATRNVRSFGQPTRWSPGWAIGGWFIPLANLVIPFMVVTNARRGTAPSQEVPKYYYAWWLLFVGAQVISRSAGFDTADDVDQLLSDNLRAMLAVAALMVSAVIGTLVPRDLARAQHERAGA